ncbi:MAG: sugar ABC transporter permease, partial [Actinobacteria bacterium]|nr:sugar ABC transporter permease [Actinomycetota bacterium]
MESENRGKVSSVQMAPRTTRPNRPRRRVPVAPYVFLLPIGGSIFLSFTNYNIIHAPKLVGIQNYIHLFKSPLFWLSVRHTLIFVAFVPLGVLIAFLAALLLNALPWGQALFRFLFYLPSALSSVAVGVLMAFLISFGPNSILSHVFADLGFPAGLNFTGPQLFLWFVLFSGMLTGWGPSMVIFSAGLTGIKPELYESARLDGAVGMKIHWYVTLPMLKLTTIYVVITGMISAFQVFESLFVIGSLATGNEFGPLNSGITIVPLLYEKGFSYLEFGYASAIGVVLVIVVMILTVIGMRVSHA